MPTPFTKEQIATANSVNLIDYATMNGYKLENGGKQSLHAKNSGGLYLFKDKNRYYSFTADKSGGPIDFVMEYEGKDFISAVEHLLGERPNDKPYQKATIPTKSEKGELVLPDKAKDYKRVYWYLCSVRGIMPEIVSKLMNERKLYQQANRGNCVFVGYDENKTPKYCSMRGTSTEKAFKMDKDNSDKSYPFSMQGTSNTLFVTESPIDVMSHASLFKLNGLDYTKDHRISLGCLSDAALERYLTVHPEIKRIIFALDNDIDGKAPDGTPCNHGQLAAVKFYDKYSARGFEIALHKPDGKDFNEDLLFIKNSKIVEMTVDTKLEQGDEDDMAL